VTLKTFDPAPAESLIERFRGKRGALIPLLQAIQAEYGYVPRETIQPVAEALELFPSDVFGVLTFYAQFYLEPRGQFIIKVCQGTACHVMGSSDLVDYLRRQLSIEDGGTTADGVFTLERVACLGCCGMAPVLAVNDEFHGNFTVQQLDQLLADYRAKAAGQGAA
jgi:NADH-quinone oxidoreductase subunit E